MELGHDSWATRPAVPGLGAMGMALIAVGAMVVGILWHGSQTGTSASQPACTLLDATQQPPEEESRFVEARRRMVEEQLRSRDITDPKVLAAMGRIARQRFAPEKLQHLAYADRALPIDEHQTISQPYIVALMTQTAQPTAQSRALEIGTGSGYQAAVLAELCKEVYSIEILKPLADSARQRLAVLGYKNVTTRHGDGYQGWREHAPFDVILVTAAPDHVPPALLEQLAIGGRMVIPVGRGSQDLLTLEKQQDGTIRRKMIAPVLFVPMTGEAQKQPE